MTSVLRRARHVRAALRPSTAMATALAAPARTASVRAAAPGARGATSRVSARRAALPRPSTFGNVTRSSRRPVRPAAAVSPNEVNELAASTLLTLSGLETVLGKVSFGSLLTATSIFEYKVRHQTLIRERAPKIAERSLSVSFSVKRTRD
jgi:hypothetical protein